MFRVLGRIVSWLFGLEERSLLLVGSLPKPPSSQAVAVAAAPPKPLSVGEVISLAWKMATDRKTNGRVRVTWNKDGTHKFTVEPWAGLQPAVCVDIENFPNRAKVDSTKRRPDPVKVETLTPEQLAERNRSHKESCEAGLRLVLAAAKDCDRSKSYRAFVDPATMERTEEPHEVRQMYSLYLDQK